MTKDINELSIVDLLDYVLESNEANQKRIYNPLRPSSAGKCQKALWFELQEFKDQSNITAESRSGAVCRLLDYGYWTEEHLIKMFEKMYETFNIKVKYKQQVVDTMILDDKSIIEGSCDFALESDDGNIKILVDAKSTKDAFNKAFKTRWDDNINKWNMMKSFKKISNTCFYADNAMDLVREFGDDFKIDNIKQLNLYLGSDFFQKRGYKYGSLFYYVKNDSRLFELRFKYNEELKQSIVDKFNFVNKTLDPIKVKNDFNLGSIRCAFCKFNDKCWDNTNPLKEYFKTLPKKEFPINIDKIDSPDLVKLFDNYENLVDNLDKKSKIESNIVKILHDKKIRRVKLNNGNVYDVRLLKSPREHLELRRSKL